MTDHPFEPIDDEPFEPIDDEPFEPIDEPTDEEQLAYWQMDYEHTRRSYERIPLEIRRRARGCQPQHRDVNFDIACHQRNHLEAAFVNVTRFESRMTSHKGHR